MNELIARCAGQFIPKSADDFIGDNIVERANGTVTTGARAVALHIEKMARLAKNSGNAPIKLLLTGEPGLGKSALVCICNICWAATNGARPNSTARS